MISAEAFLNTTLYGQLAPVIDTLIDALLAGELEELFNLLRPDQSARRGRGLTMILAATS